MDKIELDMILSNASIGKYRVLSIFNCRYLTERLASIGIIKGAKIEVIDNNKFMSLMIRVRDSDLVIGKGMASKIEVIKE